MNEEEALEQIEELVEEVESTESLNKINDIVKKRYVDMVQEESEKFEVGETVSFEHKGYRLEEEIVRKNKKTITVEGEDVGGPFKARVAPEKLRKE